jgi:hypothetical protein
MTRIAYTVAASMLTVATAALAYRFVSEDDTYTDADVECAVRNRIGGAFCATAADVRRCRAEVLAVFAAADLTRRPTAAVYGMTYTTDGVFTYDAAYLASASRPRGYGAYIVDADNLEAELQAAGWVRLIV